MLDQIKAAFERSLKKGKTHNFQLTLPEPLAEQAEEALKSSYNLEFLGIGRAIKEKQLEDRLIERLRHEIADSNILIQGAPIGMEATMDKVRRSRYGPAMTCPSIPRRTSSSTLHPEGNRHDQQGFPGNLLRDRH